MGLYSLSLKLKERYETNNKAIFITSHGKIFVQNSSMAPGASQSYRYMNEHIDFFNYLKKDIQKNFIFRVSKNVDDLYKTNYIDRMQKTFKY